MENIGLVLGLVMIFLIYWRVRTGGGIYGVFAGFISFYFAITLAESSIMLTTIFGLLGIYLIFEAFYKGANQR